MDELFVESTHRQAYDGTLSPLEKIWYYCLKPTLVFPTSKVIKIVDWRLALIFRGLQAIILVYFTWQALKHQQYLRKEVPENVLSVYVTGGNVTQRQFHLYEVQRTGSDPSPNNYCNSNSSYDFLWSESWKYIFQGCVSPIPGQLADKGPLGSSYFFKTAMQSTLYQHFKNREANTTDEHCMKVFSEQPEDVQQGIMCLPSANEELKEGIISEYYIQHHYHQENFVLSASNVTMCGCTSVSGRFYTGVDELFLYIDHFFYSTHVTGALTKTYIRKIGSRSNKKVFQEGETLAMTLKDILEWAEVELDQRANEGLNAQWLEESSETEIQALQGPLGIKDDKFPYVRVSGVRVEVSMEYYNYRMVPGEVHAADQAEVLSPDNSDAKTVCVMYFRPYLVWTSQGNQFERHGDNPNYYIDVYNYGVLVTFKAGGLVGGFDSFMLFLVMTQTIVMLDLAGQITTIIARSMLGTKSILYKSVISERLDALTIYGRFASQAITASLCYDIVDNNNSGRVSKPEIYAQLSKLFHRSMSKNQMATLVEFVVYMAHLGKIPRLDSEATGEDNDLGANSEEDDEEDEEHDEAGIEKSNMDKGRKGSLIKTIAETKVHRRKRSNKKLHVTRSQWVSVFTGPPCSLQQCIDVIDRKSVQGHFQPNDEDLESYEVTEKKLQQFRKLRRPSSQVIGDVNVFSRWKGQCNLAPMRNDSQVLGEIQVLRDEIMALRTWKALAESKFAALENHLETQLTDRDKERDFGGENLPIPPIAAPKSSFTLALPTKCSTYVFERMYNTTFKNNPTFEGGVCGLSDEEEGGMATNRAMFDESNS